MDYAKITDYAAKDLLLHLDPLKTIKGAEVGAEFDAIATMSATKANTSALAASGGAALIGNTPAGSIAATTVQAAINELDTEKAALAGSASQAFSVAAGTGSQAVNKTQADAAYAALAGLSTQTFFAAAGTTTNQVVNYGQALGLGQTWQDMTASRALNTTYTNTTGKPIVVKLWSAPSAFFAESIFSISGEGAGGYSLTYIVPAGANYGQVSNQGGAFTFSTWMELR